MLNAHEQVYDVFRIRAGLLNCARRSQSSLRRLALLLDLPGPVSKAFLTPRKRKPVAALTCCSNGDQRNISETYTVHSTCSMWDLPRYKKHTACPSLSTPKDENRSPEILRHQNCLCAAGRNLHRTGQLYNVPDCAQSQGLCPAGLGHSCYSAPTAGPRSIRKQTAVQSVGSITCFWTVLSVLEVPLYAMRLSFSHSARLDANCTLSHMRDDVFSKHLSAGSLWWYPTSQRR